MRGASQPAMTIIGDIYSGLPSGRAEFRVKGVAMCLGTVFAVVRTNAGVDSSIETSSELAVDLLVRQCSAGCAGGGGVVACFVDRRSRRWVRKEAASSLTSSALRC